MKWRLGRAIYLLSEVETGEVKQKLVLEAYQYIKEALDSDDKHCAVNTWYAIVLDAKSFLVGLRERIKNLGLFEQHLKVRNRTCLENLIYHS